MRTSARACLAAFSRQHSQRTTRRTLFSSTGFQPVSSHSGQGIDPILSVQVRAQVGRTPQLVFRARFDLPHALAREVQLVANLLQRARLVVSEPEPQAHDLPFLAVELPERRGELVEVRLTDHLV